MPELPEVETTRAGIAPFCEGQRIDKVLVRNSSLRWPVPADLAAQCQRKTIKRVLRRAKYLIFELQQGGQLISHLGMTGRFQIAEPHWPADKHDHIDITLQNGKILRYHDPRRFGAMLYSQDWRQEKLFSHLGPEPLTETFNGQYLKHQANNRKSNIKQLIMNNHIVVGVGNIYANEALFISGISPKRQATNISLQRYEQLAKNIKQVLNNAIAQGGTTLQDFAQPNGNKGYFALELKVYGKAEQACPRCDGTIKKISQQGRSSFYCPNCQH